MAMQIREGVEGPRRDRLRSIFHMAQHHEHGIAPSESRDDRTLKGLVRKGVRVKFATIDDVHMDKSVVRFQKIRVRYLEAGEMGMPELIGIHGSGTSNSIRSWHENVVELGRHFHVILPDIPGFGKTDKNLGMSTVEYYAKDFLPRFADVMGLERFHLMGTSIGGAIATIFALDNPLMVDHLVDIAAYGFDRGNIDPIRYLGTRSTKAIEVLQSLADTQFFRNHPEMTYPIVKFVMKHISKGMKEKIKHEEEQGKVIGLEETKEYLMERLPLAELQLLKSDTTAMGRRRTQLLGRVHDLERYGVQVLFVVGANDPLVDSGGIDKAEAMFSKGKAFLYKIEGVEHGPQIHRSGEVNRLITDFLHGDYSLLRG